MVKNMPLISRCVSRLNDSKKMKSSSVVAYVTTIGVDQWLVPQPKQET